MLGDSTSNTFPENIIPNNKSQYIKQIKNFIGEINDFMEKNKYKPINTPLPLPFNPANITISQLQSLINETNNNVETQTKIIKHKNKKQPLEFNV